MNLTTVNNVVTMSSLELVEFINSQRKAGEAVLAHSDFMKKVPSVLGEGAGNFSDTYVHPQNKQVYPCYRFPKREACLMAMSYSYELQAKVFDRMTQLEEQRKATALPDFTNPVVAARAWADEVEGRLIAEKSLEEAQPAIEFYDDVGRSDSLVRIGDAAKSFGFGRNKFFKFLREKKIMQKDINIPYQRFIEAGMFEVKYQSYIDECGAPQVRPVTFITGKGLTYIHKVIDG